MSDKESKAAQIIPGDLLYGVPACAEFLGITERQARHRFATGQLPSFRIGESICSRKSTLATALDRMEQQSQSAPDPAAD